MFEIFVDSAANIPAELVKAFKIKVLSFVNLVNGKEMTCFYPDLTPEEERQKGKDYYDMIRTGADIKTGLISSGVFEERYYNPFVYCHFEGLPPSGGLCFFAFRAALA